MNTLKQYTIPYKGLSIGGHRFEFKMDDRFFEAFEGSEVQQGDADVTVQLDRQSNMLVLDFDIRAGVTVTCDRCLDEFRIPVVYQDRLIVRFSETEQDQDGEVLWISPAETELDLAQYIYESIMLSLPYQRIHPRDERGATNCNPEMLARFIIAAEEENEQDQRVTRADE